MKKEELTELGLTDEQITKVFEMNGKDVNAAKDSTKASMQSELDSVKQQLGTATEALKKFDGVDPEQLTGEIQKLNNQLMEQKTAFDKQIADRDFNDTLASAITKSGGRNAKAIAALMDIEALRASKNQREDIEAAIETLKKDNDYLFSSDEPINNPVAKTGGKKPEDSAARKAAARKALGLPEEKREDK